MEIKEKIIELLKNHPEGLTLKDIAGKLNVSRVTATKYIFELKGEGLIRRRRVGSGILHYLISSESTKIGKERVALNGKSLNK
jgi:Fic family protein